MNKIDNIFIQFGFKSLDQYLQSTFHLNLSEITITFSLIMTGISVLLNKIFGFNLTVFLVLVILFASELYTGIKASKKEGKAFSSKRMSAGWIKLFTYMLMIGCANLLALNMPQKSLFGYETNIYEWLHIAFLHFTAINLFISNLENFARLGWDEYVPIIKKINSFLKINQNETD